MIRSILDAIIDEELLVQKAKDEKVEVSDNDVNADVDKRMQTIRTRFTTKKEFRDELKKSGFGTVDEFRRWLLDQSRRSQLQQKLFEKLRTRRQDRASGRLRSRSRRVLQQELEPAAEAAGHGHAASDRHLAETQRRTRIRWRSRRPSRCTSRSRKGGDFEQIAKRESMDPARRSSAATSAGAAAATSCPSSIACTSRCARAS